MGPGIIGGAAAMSRIVLASGVAGLAVLSTTLVLGSLGAGISGAGGRGHAGLGAGLTATGVVVHLSAMATLVVVGGRVRRVEARGLGPDLPGNRLGARSIRNARRASPIASAAVVLLGLAALTGLAADAAGSGSGSGWAALGHLATTSVALGFNLVAFGIEAVSVLAQRRLLLEARRLAGAEAGPPPGLPAAADGPGAGRIPDRRGAGNQAEDE
jgi:hypothetical protein